MDLLLTDKRALVTGASRGIGLAVARRLVAEGATVVSGSRENSPELEALNDVGTVVQIAVDLLTDSGPSDLERACGSIGPSLTHCGHKPGRNPAAQQSPPVPTCAILSVRSPGGDDSARLDS